MNNKLLKILIAIEFVLVLVIIALALIGGKQTAPTAYAVKESPSIEEIKFKVLTKAVCEEKPEHVFCHDELFIKCNDTEYLVSNYPPEDFIECNNIKINLSGIKASGKTKFKKEWADLRK